MRYASALPTVAVAISVALAGCGSSHAGTTTTEHATTGRVTTGPSTTGPSTAASSAVTPLTAVGPRLSPPRAAAFKKACAYFSGDYGALTGELKMSNLTGEELREAARYVAEDLVAVAPALEASQRNQVARAEILLATTETNANSQTVSSQEASSLIQKFQSAPFSTLSNTVGAACRYPPRVVR
jgi:hypothetical protein